MDWLWYHSSSSSTCEPFLPVPQYSDRCWSNEGDQTGKWEESTILQIYRCFLFWWTRQKGKKRVQDSIDWNENLLLQSKTSIIHDDVVTTIEQLCIAHCANHISWFRLFRNRCDTSRRYLIRKVIWYLTWDMNDVTSRYRCNCRFDSACTSYVRRRQTERTIRMKWNFWHIFTLWWCMIDITSTLYYIKDSKQTPSILL